MKGNFTRNFIPFLRFAAGFLLLEVLKTTMPVPDGNAIILPIIFVMFLPAGLIFLQPAFRRHLERRMRARYTTLLPSTVLMGGFLLLYAPISTVHSTQWSHDSTYTQGKAAKDTPDGSIYSSRETAVSSPATVATTWADLTVYIMTKAPQNTPTYGSRALGYLGLTMYETVVGSTSDYISVATQLCDTLYLPKPPLGYSPELALNAGQAYMLKAFYGYTDKLTPPLKINKIPSIDSLETAIRDQYAAKYSPEVVERSVEYGRAVAQKIYQWSLSDGGHEGYARNFPADYIVPKGDGIWVPSMIGQVITKIPMHPYWGQNRTFAPQNAQLPMPKPLPYSTDTASAYYQQFKEVYTRSKTLTDTERKTVMWWGDDPGHSCSPPGHSYNLATIAIRKDNADLVKAALTYCRVGMAVADAFIFCWKTKFTYMVERPVTFIAATMHSPKVKFTIRYGWTPFFAEPPFPAFFSGHATQAAAMAEVMTDLYGQRFAFTDSTHVGRYPDMSYNYQLNVYDRLDFTPRSYDSFWEAASDCAESRLLGGIHTRYDNEVGLSEGRKIGQQINKLNWK